MATSPDCPQTHHCTQVERLALIAAAADTTREIVEEIKGDIKDLDQHVRQALITETEMQAECRNCKGKVSDVKAQMKSLWALLGAVGLLLLGTLVTLAVSGCRREVVETETTFAVAQERRDVICLEMMPAQIERCDYGTFASLVVAFCPRVSVDFAVASLEDPAGKWRRHFDACYPAESKTETSKDTYLSVLHLAHGLGESGLPILYRIRDYVKAPLYLTGEGDPRITSIMPLMPLLTRMLSEKREGGFETLPFQASLLANYVWLVARVTGGMSEIEYQALAAMRAQNPENPWLQALYHNLKDGDHEDTLKALEEYDMSSNYGWGSAPPGLQYILAVAVMENQ